MTTVTRPALRYHGAKFRLAKWIMQFFPAHDIYVESYGGAAGILLQKPRSRAEVYNDLNGDVVNFFKVLRDIETRSRLVDAIIHTPYAREEFDKAYEHTYDAVESARRLVIRAFMGFGSAGATKGSTGFRIDTKRAYNTVMDLWAQYPECISSVGERFQGVLIEMRKAVDVMFQHDALETLHYVDPPYILDTRSGGGNRYYRHEMTDSDHLELLATLKHLQGYVVLSGYPHRMYDDNLSKWKKYETKARISAGRGTAIRTECVWLNPACAEALELEQNQRELFKEVSNG